MYLSLENYFQKYKNSHPDEYHQLFVDSAKDLISRVECLLHQVFSVSNQFVIITQSSGWRPPSVNTTISLAKESSHTLGKGIDLSDPKKLLQNLILEFPHLLKIHGLWMESPFDSKDHVHLDTLSRSERPINIFRA